MFKFVNIYVLVASFLIGLAIMHFMNPDKKKIYVYPTPENVDILLHRDNANNCFKYVQKEVKCPSNESMITKIVPQ